MKARRWLCLILSFLLVVSIPVAVFAHPGRTDPQGGHYDRSTGEYHFHHGYPAHDHYDMDGDGKPDCPYDFVDNTNYDGASQNYDSISGEKAEYINEEKSITEEQIGTINETKLYDKTKEAEEVPVWLLATFFGATIFFSMYSFYLHNEVSKLKNTNDNLRESFSTERETLLSQFEKDKKFLEDEFHNDLQKIADTYEQNFDDDIVRALAKVPREDILNEDLLPVSQEGSAHLWGNKYTFFLSSTKKYHRMTCNYAKPSSPINAYTVYKRRYVPCTICKPDLPDVSWVERYKEYRKLFDKYHIITPKEKYTMDNSETR